MLPVPAIDNADAVAEETSPNRLAEVDHFAANPVVLTAREAEDLHSFETTLREGRDRIRG